MAGSRYVLLGLASARSAWFRDVAQWANSSSIPAEFVKCVSTEEVRARLASGRPFSALLVDSTVPSLDRDLVETAQQASCAAIVVDDRRGGRDWLALGANASLPAGFDRKSLLDTLGAHAVMISRVDRLPDDGGAPDSPGAWQAPLAAVCWSGGTGASTLAIALAQGLGDDVRARGAVVLADFALHAEQAMLHDARDTVPGVQELVEACRSGQPTQTDVRDLTYAINERGYSLLLGLRRSRAWATIRPRGFTAALEALRRSYSAVVADVDADVEGEDDGGSVDVEERHAMARTTLAAADVVAVVGSPGMKGLHSLVRVMAELVAFGVPRQRLLPVVNRAPRAPRSRALLAAAVAELVPGMVGPGVADPLFLPERRVDEALRDGARPPDSLCAPLVRAVAVTKNRAETTSGRSSEPVQVVPGSISHWASGPDDADPETASG
jgi:hypothetical protein